MFPTKRNNYITHWKIFVFSGNTLYTKSQQNYQINSQIGRKNIPNIWSHTERFLLKYFLPRISWIFNDNIQWLSVKWQYSMAKCQRLTPRLITKFSWITQPVVIQKAFVMLFLDNFIQWNTLYTKEQSTNPTEINFRTVNCKIRKKGYVDIHLFY